MKPISFILDQIMKQSINLSGAKIENLNFGPSEITNVKESKNFATGEKAKLNIHTLEQSGTMHRFFFPFSIN